jgi:hypothetical protein
MDELLVYAEVTISLNVADTGNVLQATIDRLDAIIMYCVNKIYMQKYLLQGLIKIMLR